MFFLLAFCCILTYYFHSVLGSHIVFSHIFYIPIVLSAVWWRRKGVIVAVFLGVSVLLSHLFFKTNDQNIESYFRVLMFVIVSLVVARMRMHIDSAEESLQKSDIHLRALIGTIPDLVWLKNLQGIYITCNSKFERLFGVKESDIVGKTDYDFVDKELADFFREKDKAVMVAGKPIMNEEEITYADDGHVELLETIKTPMHNSDGRLIGVLGIARDITERKKMEAALQDSENRYRSLSEAAFEAIFISEKGICLEQNRAAEMMFGYTSSEAVGRSGTEWIIPQDREIVLNNMMSGYEEPYEATALRKDGSTFPAEIQGKMMHYKGRAVRVTALRDITERKRSEDELRESEEKVRTLYDSSSDAIMLLDENGFFDCNDSTLRLFGCATREEFYRRHPADFSPPAQPDGTDSMIYARNNIAFALKEGHKRFEHLHRRLDGTDFPAEVLLDVMELGGRKVLQARVYDITERKKVDKEQDKLQAQLTQAQKMESVGRLAGGVAHDFNNMLSVILGHSDMALDQMDSDHPFFEGFQEIRTAAERSADLTRQLLAFARKQTITPMVLDLNEIVTSMLNMLRRLIGEDIDLSWLPGSEVWPIKVDPSQIDQVLANLCVNSRDSIEDVGKITIRTKNASPDEAYCANYPGFYPGEYVLLTVSDNGCGMDKETLDKIYEPFFTTKGIGKGTGLGLSTVYGIVKQNNGYIGASSEPGKGSAFSIYLPRHANKPEVVQKEDSTEPAQRGHETILLVEDEPSVMEMTTIMLERQGYIVLPASTPEESISLARELSGEINLLVTDVVMPEMNGRDLACKLLSFYPNLRCLFMSGYTANVIALQGVLDEGVFFIQKPFALKNLAMKVREVLDSESGRPGEMHE